ncbi:MAG: FeoB small GTPase domain-containing protein [Candidatus Omnitrophota bacterium]
MIRKIAIVGNPNVGKSVLFNNLTGSYAIVSNYPGTTVEVSRGKANISGFDFEIIDTPGMYSLLPITEEERVTRKILFNEKPCLVIHVIDTKNLERMLSLTLQLKEAGFPLIIDLNIMDEALSNGIEINILALEKELGVPIVETVSTLKEGMDILKTKIMEICR